MVDRIRHLVTDLDQPDVKRDKIKRNEIQILLRRGKILKYSIAWLLIGMISSCLIIPLLFIMSLLGTDLKMIGTLLFVISILSLFVSLIYFFKDVLSSLHAISLEASEYIK